MPLRLSSLLGSLAGFLRAIRVIAGKVAVVNFLRQALKALCLRVGGDRRGCLCGGDRGTTRKGPVLERSKFGFQALIGLYEGRDLLCNCFGDPLVNRLLDWSVRGHGRFGSWGRGFGHVSFLGRGVTHWVVISQFSSAPGSGAFRGLASGGICRGGLHDENGEST